MRLMKTSYCTCKTVTDCFGLNELLLQSWTCYRKIHLSLSLITHEIWMITTGYLPCKPSSLKLHPIGSFETIAGLSAVEPAWHFNARTYWYYCASPLKYYAKAKKHLLGLWTWSNSKHFLLTPSLRLSSAEQFPTGRKIIWAETGWRRRRMSVARKFHHNRPNQFKLHSALFIPSKNWPRRKSKQHGNTAPTVEPKWGVAFFNKEVLNNFMNHGAKMLFFFRISKFGLNTRQVLAQKSGVRVTCKYYLQKVFLV